MIKCACLPSRRGEQAAVTSDTEDFAASGTEPLRQTRHGPFHAVACSSGLAIASCCWHEQSRLRHRLVAWRIAGPMATPSVTAVDSSMLLSQRLDLTSGSISPVRGRRWNGARTTGGIKVLWVWPEPLCTYIVQ